MPHHKSCKKRLRTSIKETARNKAARSTIRTSLKLIRTADKKEVVEKEVPRLFSLLDKAARKHLAGFTKNRAGNYKSKIQKVLNSYA
ncbi:MAG: 30S ribosomal protein S20 [Fibrobacterales bacterium]